MSHLSACRCSGRYLGCSALLSSRQKDGQRSQYQRKADGKHSLSELSLRRLCGRAHPRIITQGKMIAKPATAGRRWECHPGCRSDDPLR